MKYKIHFGFSTRSKYYPQAVKLAELAETHEIIAQSDDDLWHIVTLNENQIDLMAQLYPIAIKINGPRVRGADLGYLYAYVVSKGTYDYVHASKTTKNKVSEVTKYFIEKKGWDFNKIKAYLLENYINPISKDMQAVREKLISEEMLDYRDNRTNSFVYAKRKPIEQIDVLREIKNLIQSGNHKKAISRYYEYLGNNLYSNFTKELIYLKRLAKKNLKPRDILYFLAESSRSELIKRNLDEYIECLDDVLQNLKNENRETPLEILLKNVPTMEQLIEHRNKRVSLWDGVISKDFKDVSIRNFSTAYDFCPGGRIFDRYPDPIAHCDIYEPINKPEYMGIWSTYSKDFIEQNIYDKGFHLTYIEAYKHISWHYFRGKYHKQPLFESVNDIESIVKNLYRTDDVEFTGVSHKINNHLFFEINLNRVSLEREKIGNPFKDLINDVFRESENKLREEHNLPRIGEGWISETQLFYLVKEEFEDATQHHSPEWLYPQHLDVFIPSKNIAIEYQGRQHFEPVDFFGGVETFQDNLKRDKRKKKKCKDNKVKLIEWHYETPINKENLDIILRKNEEG